MCKRHFWLPIALLSLAACSTGIDTIIPSASEGDNLATETISGSVKGALEAVKSPFVDLNLTHDDIPEHLQVIAGNPYAVPSPLQCKVVKDELHELDGLLGPDMANNADTKKADKDGKDGNFLENIDYAEEGSHILQKEAIGFVSGKVSIIPFRGVVRHITGASKQAKAYALAYETGKLRRAYLKGLTSALKCEKPIAVAKDTKPAVVLAKKEGASL